MANFSLLERGGKTTWHTVERGEETYGEKYRNDEQSNNKMCSLYSISFHKNIL